MDTMQITTVGSENKKIANNAWVFFTPKIQHPSPVLTLPNGMSWHYQLIEKPSHECSALANYVHKSQDLITTLFHNTPSQAQKFLMNYLDGPKSANVEETDNQYLADLRKKPLHSLFVHEQAE
eukprot:15366872-Ditylum_brightwellii.AAC.1